MQTTIAIPAFKALAYLRDPIKECTVGLNEKNIVKKWLNHGHDLFIVGGNAELQPAAPAIVKPTMSQGELPNLKKQKAAKIKKEVVLVKPQAKPVKPKKPLVDTITGIYYPSATEAGEAIGTSRQNISTKLGAAKRGKPRKGIGSQLRFATPEEVKAHANQ